nr:MarR family transcriptional regulator [uncultured Gemmiger sp.]
MVPILTYAQHYKKYYSAQFAGAAAAYGLNQLEIDILLFLHNNPELCTASDICRYRGLAKSNVSAAVERLRSRGVLEVLPAPDNRRQRILRFTGAARPMAEALAEIQRRTLEPLFDGFTAAEQQALQEYLCRMDANIQRHLKKE